ncbi:MAG: LysM peptidoglycan-binding domain-containing protein [Egibacteraceae bacterium]
MHLGRGLVLVATAAALSGCGGDEPAAPGPTEAASTPAATEAPTVEQGQAARRPRTYEVKRGDTLSSIAAEFDTTVDALIKANDLDDPDQIFPGDELRIPRP